MADFLLAAWFWWMTPLLAALSSFFDARSRAAVALSLSPAAIAVRVARTAVRSSLLTARLRSVDFWLVRMRLICDLIFATFITFCVCVFEQFRAAGPVRLDWGQAAIRANVRHSEASRASQQATLPVLVGIRQSRRARRGAHLGVAVEQRSGEL